MSFGQLFFTMLAAVASILLIWFEVIGFAWAFILVLLFIARPLLAKGSKATLVNFSWALLVVTLLGTLVSYWGLGQDRVQAVIYGKKLLSQVLSGTTGRVVLSILMGLLASLLAIILPLYLILRVSTEWILALGESMGIDKKLAWRLLFSLVMRINKPYIIVEDGEKRVSKSAGILEAIGGPGLVIVRPYNAIVCELSGQVSKVVGSGTATLDLFEIIKATISLRRKWESFDLADVMTMDHVPLLVRGGVGFRIMDAQAARELRGRAGHIVRKWHKVVGEPDYPVYQWTLYKAVYGVSESKDWDWMKQAKGVASAQVRAAISQYRLDEIFIVDEQQRVAMREPIAKAIADEAKDNANEITSEWGVVTGEMVVDFLEMPRKVQEDFLERWRFSWKGWQTVLEAAASGAAGVLQASDEGLANYIKSLGEGQARLVEGDVEAQLEWARTQAELWRMVAEAQARRVAAPFEEDVKHIAAIRKAMRHWEVMKIGTGEEAARIAATELEAELKAIEQVRQAEARQEVATKDALANYITAIADAVSRWEVSEIDAEIAETVALGESAASLITTVGEALQHWEAVRIGTEAGDMRRAEANLEAEIEKIAQLGRAESRRDVAEIDARARDTLAASELRRQRGERVTEADFYEHLVDLLSEKLEAKDVGGVMRSLVQSKASVEQLRFLCSVLDVAKRGPPALASRWRIIAGEEGPEDEDMDIEEET